MRNWNIFSVKLISWPPALFILPMRNWNLYCVSTSFILQILFILPMRNWNEGGGILPGLRPYLFILPMRNWNFVQAFLRQGGLNTFYITYEELKQYNNRFRFHLSLKAFYITYEELKQINRFIIYRDWVYNFLYYLWGIETRHHHQDEN